ncbi:MAG: aminoacetone oxidase family FAD-binding enzyme, partial [Proteobacteria bacterium]|nr:aminoacetone oxidase family FAD-binding enzyme [Pseudomonadota bacterium]
SFAEVFGKQGKFLYSALFEFGVDETLDFFNSCGLRTVTERGHRVFPASNKAGDVLNLLKKFVENAGVTTLTKADVKTLVKEGNAIRHIEVGDSIIQAERYIVCTGGLSYPSTGSTGDGMKWAEVLGHTLVPPQPSLVHLNIREPWGNAIRELNLKNVAIRAFQNNKKVDEQFGEAFFVTKGIGGPIVLDMSKRIGTLLEKGPVLLKIDLKPALDFKTLDLRIQRDLKANSNRMFKNSLDELLPKMLIPVIIDLSNIAPEKKCHSLTKPERQNLARLLKELEVNVHSIGGFEKAIITCGGISLKEIDPKTMKSNLVDNLYFAGEIIDLDGPTGGYNLQVCWSTGHLAGTSAAT